MTLKIQDILGFASFYEVAKSAKLPIKTSYRLNQLNKAISEELQFYREKVQIIIKQFGELDENGNPILTEDGKGVKLRPGMENECSLAMQELQTLEITLPDICFSIEELGSMELSASEIEAIIPFIKE